MARVTFRPQLIDYLLSCKGGVVTMNELMSAMPDGAKESSVRSAMRRMIEEGHFQIRTLAAGHSWAIDGLPASQPKSHPAPNVADWGVAKARAAKPVPQGVAVGPFVRLGEMADGSALVRDENDGMLYTLKRL
jgi:hypothetical protein